MQSKENVIFEQIDHHKVDRCVTATVRAASKRRIRYGALFITFLLNREEIIEILKHLIHLQERNTRPRPDIIHPMDSFTTSPSLTSEKVSTIKLKLNQISTLGKKSGRTFTESLRSNSPSSATGEHLSVQELHSGRIESTCFVSPSIMESLPDPPQLSVEQLPRLEMMNRIREVQKSMTADSMEVASEASPSERSVINSTPIGILPVPSPRAGSLSAKETPVLSSCGDFDDGMNSPPSQALTSVTPNPSSSALRSVSVENSGHQPILVDEEREFNSGITRVTVSEVKCDFRKRHR
ncbi:hypothetical protein GCK32_013247 [Trichostrongylus colubriformis]|uniref:Uncharacterized protein n=1 Tax=Trichostrongylus colubriformis TaxID=6319 RepID=A0AAN8IPC5_TRICO